MARTDRTTGLSLKLARIAVIVAIGLGILTSLVELWFDYRDQKASINETALRALSVAEASASDAAHQLDKTLAEELVAGLMNYTFVQQAGIYDELGNTLADETRQGSIGGMFWLTEMLGDPFPAYATELSSPEGARNVGSLHIVVNVDQALSEFYSRVIVNFLTGIAKSLILSAILFLVFFRIAARPLVALVREISKVDPQRPTPIVAVSEYHGDDEIGLLQSTVNKHLDASRGKIEDYENAQDELRVSQVRMNDFARAASDWFWETNASGFMTYASARFFETTGHEPSTFLVSTDSEVETNDAQSPHEKFRWVQTSRKHFRDFEYSIVRDDKSTIHIHASGVPVADDAGRFIGYRGVGADRTDLYRSEQERMRLAEELNHSQKLRTIGQLAGGIAHDFNNLLAVIMGCIEEVQSKVTKDRDVKDVFDMALNATQRGAVLTHRLLAYSRQQPLSPSPLDPKQVLTGIDELLRRTLGEHIELELVVSGGVWRCIADQQELETVILNLAINARDAMPEGGKLTIEAFNSKLDEVYALSGFEVDPGQYVCFAVTDNGIGMDEDVMFRAFDPYFTTKSVGKGSGLGLSMAFGFAKQSKGHIKIYSEPGEGTTIKVYLPRTLASSNEAAADRHHLPEENQLIGRKVLVVEDEPAVRNMLERRLKHIGCEPVVAREPEEALEKCRENPSFDLFLLDVVLPGPMKSPDLAAKLLDINPGASVIYMSGYTENSIVHGGQLDDGVRLLQKPFSTNELKATLIRAILE